MVETHTRQSIASHIAARLEGALGDLKDQWDMPGRIPSAVIDGLLPQALAADIHACFPTPERMMFKSSLRERKHVAAQMDRYHPLLEEAVYAFQDARVVALIEALTGFATLEPDTELYAGGISAMTKGAYLRPHLDNSHDGGRRRYRALNLLFYVTPGWTEADGGALQLWDDGPRGPARTIASRCNRLVLMATDRRSWHSVNEVVGAATRTCVSNYYFSAQPPAGREYFHATSFRAEHGTGARDLVMRADNLLRTAVLKATGDRLYRNPHVYRRPEEG